MELLKQPYRASFNVIIWFIYLVLWIRQLQNSFYYTVGVQGFILDTFSGITWQSKFSFSPNKNVMFLRIMFVGNYLYLEGETYLFSMICQKMC